MTTPLFFTTILIAACTLSTGATAQKVYRCGSSYSQTPCPDAVTIEVEDTRSKAQKSESDARVRHEAKAADAMEKKRLQDEAQSLVGDNAKTAVHGKTSTRANANTTPRKTSAAGDAPTPTDKDKKKSGGKKKEPEFFTARVAPQKSKAKTPNAANP